MRKSMHPVGRFVEPLEDRKLASISWVNRGDPSDHFAEVFGAAANVARGVVDSAIAEWNRTVTGFKGSAFDVDLTVSMDPSNDSISAVGGPGAKTAAGVPITGHVTINTAGPIGSSDWFLDPTPDNHSEFQGELKNAFARNPTPGGPADGKRDLRTILIHEIGHVMGIYSNSPLMYDNLDVIMHDTNLDDLSTATPDDEYWIFQGPSVNALMTSNDLNADATSKAGHAAAARDGNPRFTWGDFDLFGAVDTMQPTGLSVRRALLSKKTALILSDMGYDVTPPERFGTFHAMLNPDTGILDILGGNDDVQINGVNQGPSADAITLTRSGSRFVVSVNLGVDVPGTGPGMDINDQQGAFVSRFSVSAVRGVRVHALGGDDSVTASGNFSFLDQGLYVWGGDGNDTLSAADLINAQVANLHGDDGNDTITGGPGRDHLYGELGNDAVYGLSGNDDLIGGGGNDTLRGGAGADYLLGGDGSDFLQGDAGNDNLSGNDGNDTLVGGSVLASLAGFIVADGADVLAGNDGDDVLYGDHIYHNSSVANGGGGNDLLRGGDGNDIGWGGAGRDDMHGDAGDDSLHGQWSNDRLYGDQGSDQLWGEAGNDLIYGMEGDDFLSGGDGKDRLFGGLGSDGLTGGEGDDLLVGGNGYTGEQDASADSLIGDAGNDELYGDNYHLAGQSAGGSDTLRGGAGNDTGWGGPGDDVLDGAAGSDLLWGEDGNDLLRGGQGNDLLRGQLGDDILLGDAGADDLWSAQGRDILIGGRDQDGLYGFEGEDILVSGFTAHDATTASLLAMRAEWTSPRSLLERIRNLRGQPNPAFASRFNGDVFLKSAGENKTVFFDGQANILHGEADDDWFFHAPPDATDKAVGEVSN